MRSLYTFLPLAGALILSGCSGSDDAAQAKTAAANAAPAAIKVTAGAVDTTVKKEKSKENSGQFYYAYNKEKNSTSDYNSGENKVRTTIDAYLHIKSPYERVRITMMIQRLSKNYVIKCSPCHDDYANGVIGPSLLDKNTTFIYNQIVAFKTGEKKNPLMKELVSQIDDAELKTLANEIANFNKEIRKMRNGK